MTTAGDSPAQTSLPNSFNVVLWNYRVARNDCKILTFGLRDDKAVKRVFMMIWQIPQKRVSVDKIHYIYSLKQPGVSSKSSAIQNFPVRPPELRRGAFATESSFSLRFTLLAMYASNCNFSLRENNFIYFSM